MNHLVRELDIVILLIQLSLGLPQQRVLSEGVGLDLERCTLGSFPIFLLHALLAGHGNCHPIHPLFIL